jgi:hypothetical protein
MRAALGPAILLMVSAPAIAQATPAENQAAYAAAMKCFVVNGNATGERLDAGDSAEAAAYEAQARRLFDLAVRLGQSLGYSRDRMEQDFGLAQARELPKLVKDVAYYRSAAATCRAMGLM